MHDTHRYDVIIAGAGPVGLFLACELRLAQLSVLVLEQSDDVSSPLKRLPFGMRGLSAPSVEAFYRRGLLDDICPRGAAAKGGVSQGSDERRGGHFAGIEFDYHDIDTSRWRHRLPTPAAMSVAVEMEHLERVLARRAQSSGVTLLHRAKLTGLATSDTEVVVSAGDRQFRGTWLVGCDGGRSTVRKAAGFDFTGTEPEFTGYSVKVVLADALALTPGHHYTPRGMYVYEEPGTIAMVDFDKGAFHRSRPVTREHVESVLRRISGTDARVARLDVATTWTDRAFQAGSYRKGRVLLAGDAAHIQSPLGGQGLNLGLGDAMNLGWKLAATVRGNAPGGLLDTYSAERRPVGARVLDGSRAQVLLMQPNPASRALEAIVRDLIHTRDGATYFAGRGWGLDIRYDLGNGHWLLGRSTPDFALANGTRMGDHLQDGKGVLIEFTTTDRQLQHVARPWEGKISYIAQAASETLGVRSLLVRPDGVIAWASDDTPDPSDAARHIARWF